MTDLYEFVADDGPLVGRQGGEMAEDIDGGSLGSVVIVMDVVKQSLLL